MTFVRVQVQNPYVCRKLLASHLNCLKKKHDSLVICAYIVIVINVGPIKRHGLTAMSFLSVCVPSVREGVDVRAIRNSAAALWMKNKFLMRAALPQSICLLYLPCTYWSTRTRLRWQTPVGTHMVGNNIAVFTHVSVAGFNPICSEVLADHLNLERHIELFISYNQWWW